MRPANRGHLTLTVRHALASATGPTPRLTVHPIGHLLLHTGWANVPPVDRKGDLNELARIGRTTWTLWLALSRWRYGFDPVGAALHRWSCSTFWLNQKPILGPRSGLSSALPRTVILSRWTRSRCAVCIRMGRCRMSFGVPAIGAAGGPASAWEPLSPVYSSSPRRYRLLWAPPIRGGTSLPARTLGRRKVACSRGPRAQAHGVAGP